MKIPDHHVSQAHNTYRDARAFPQTRRTAANENAHGGQPEVDPTPLWIETPDQCVPHSRSKGTFLPRPAERVTKSAASRWMDGTHVNVDGNDGSNDDRAGECRKPPHVFVFSSSGARSTMECGKPRGTPSLRHPACTSADTGIRTLNRRCSRGTRTDGKTRDGFNVRSRRPAPIRAFRHHPLRGDLNSKTCSDQRIRLVRRRALLMA
jgi:hypothetical protein